MYRMELKSCCKVGKLSLLLMRFLMYRMELKWGNNSLDFWPNYQKFLMYRMELKYRHWWQSFPYSPFSKFLMYHMELKFEWGGQTGGGVQASPVPNVPYGVEIQGFDPWAISEPRFLMYRMELKCFSFESLPYGVNRCIFVQFKNFVKFLMYRMELKVRREVCYQKRTR